ncbi:MAG: hypothetical protein GC192_00850 [Bacteroidetes bacterium]|nr:hypothetical protein [Bacteroidota bacterium]
MKKLMMSLLAILLIFAGLTTPMMAVNTTTPVPVDSTSAEAMLEVNNMTQRLEEIKAMDKSSMTRVEKKALRKEVRSIKNRMKKLSGGVYISASTLIIILILVIILA